MFRYVNLMALMSMLLCIQMCDNGDGPYDPDPVNTFFGFENLRLPEERRVNVIVSDDFSFDKFHPVGEDPIGGISLPQGCASYKLSGSQFIRFSRITESSAELELTGVEVAFPQLSGLNIGKISSCSPLGVGTSIKMPVTVELHERYVRFKGSSAIDGHELRIEGIYSEGDLLIVPKIKPGDFPPSNHHWISGGLAEDSGSPFCVDGGGSDIRVGDYGLSAFMDIMFNLQCICNAKWFTLPMLTHERNMCSIAQVWNAWYATLDFQGTRAVRRYFRKEITENGAERYCPRYTYGSNDLDSPYGFLTDGDHTFKSYVSPSPIAGTRVEYLVDRKGGKSSVLSLIAWDSAPDGLEQVCRLMAAAYPMGSDGVEMDWRMTDNPQGGKELNIFFADGRKGKAFLKTLVNQLPCQDERLLRRCIALNPGIASDADRIVEAARLLPGVVESLGEIEFGFRYRSMDVPPTQEQMQEYWNRIYTFPRIPYPW